MTRIVFVDADGAETEVDGTDGLSVMEVAIENNIEGILAECGGACACATCHVYVDDAFRAVTGGARGLARHYTGLPDLIEGIIAVHVNDGGTTWPMLTCGSAGTTAARRSARGVSRPTRLSPS